MLVALIDWQLVNNFLDLLFVQLTLTLTIDWFLDCFIDWFDRKCNSKNKSHKILNTLDYWMLMGLAAW